MFQKSEKKLRCSVDVQGVGKIPWRRKWQPTPVLLPGKSHGQRSLVGYSPWGRQESDTTERLYLLTYLETWFYCGCVRVGLVLSDFLQIHGL